MSALGQKQTYAVQHGMSALLPIATVKADSRKLVMSAFLPKADMCSATGDVRFGPIADIESIVTVQETAPEARGKITLISANLPGSVSTSIEPPCCLTMMS
jgi:hypothetical protein